MKPLVRRPSAGAAAPSAASIFARGVLLLLLVLLVGAPAWGAPVQWFFAGVAEGHFESGEVFDAAPFTGSVVFDPAAAPAPSDGEALWSHTGAPFGIEVEVAGLSFAAGAGASLLVQVFNDDTSGGEPRDVIAFSTHGSFAGNPETAPLLFALADDTATLLDQAVLSEVPPARAALSDAQLSFLDFSIPLPGCAPDCPGGNRVFGTLTHLSTSPLPEPGAALLLGAAGLVGAGWRRRQHRLARARGAARAGGSAC